MKTARRLICNVSGVTLAIALILALAACGDAVDDAPQSAQASPPPSVASEQVLPPTAAPIVTAVVSPSITKTPTATATAQDTSNISTGATATIDANPDAERLSERAMPLLTQFVANYSPRQSGTAGELAAAEFIRAYMEDLGYETKLQPVEVEHIPWDEPFVTLAGEGRPEFFSIPLSNTGYGDVTAPVVHVDRAFEEDIPDEGLQGVVALVERGEITFEEKVNRVADAGAVAAIIYNNERENFRGALQSDGRVPAVSLSQEQGRELLRLLNDEPGIQARVKVKPVMLDSQNVIAEADDQPADCGVVVLGGHYDSVANTQAAGDNGTGVVSLFLLAEELARANDGEGMLPYAVRFVFFGVEEIGIYGSMHYVDALDEADKAEIIAMLNFDAMGQGDASIQGSAQLADIATSIATDAGISLNRVQATHGFGSDHAPFINAGIPALFFFGNDFSIINSPDDVLEEVDPSIMGAHMAIALEMLQEFECKPQE
ncbi:MAG: M28 family peptidase [Chloroflexi bacterium]|nr:M28 family peptidase [Chloroflexota bacterium]